MSTAISLKVQNDIFEKTEEVLKYLKTSRNKYINEAIKKMNKSMERKILEEKLRKESKMVSKNSLDVLQEFEQIDVIFE